MLLWYEVLQIAQTIQITDDEDNLIWKLESNGFYSVKSMYAVVNFRGILPVYIQNVWEIKVPTTIRFFLWLLSHNRILTRDNLLKRQNVDDLTCVLCNENETSTHLFFDCVVAKTIWKDTLHVTRLGSPFPLEASFGYFVGA
jgi:hypothetical protein